MNASRVKPNAAHMRWLRVMATLALTGCISEQPTAPVRPLIPPRPPDHPQVLSAAWTADVFRQERRVVITPPKRGLEQKDMQRLADYFGIATDDVELSILAGDVVEIVVDNRRFSSSAVGASTPGLVRTTFAVAIRNRLTAVEIHTPTFPAPPPGTSGVILFPFETVVTETPGGVTVIGDGTSLLVELPNRGQVAPSEDWDVAPFNFFNDASCGPSSNDCYRSEAFRAHNGVDPVLLGSATSESRMIGFDHDPTVSQFRVRMIVAGDLADGSSNRPPTANAGGPYSVVGKTVLLQGRGTDPDADAVLSYSWDFDQDGEFDDSFQQEPHYTCTAPGTTVVVLRVTDQHGASTTDDADVTCIDGPPTVVIFSSDVGVLGGPVGVTASGHDDFFEIVLYEWDLDNDGQFDDAVGPTAQAFCGAPTGAGARVRVTDAAGKTVIGSRGFPCLAQPLGDVRARWTNLAGEPISTAVTGQRVILEIDMESDLNMISFEGTLFWSLNRFDLTPVEVIGSPSADLNCNGSAHPFTPGGPCPSGVPPADNVDALGIFAMQWTHPPGSAMFFNVDVFSVGAPGIQGLARFFFTVAPGAPTSVAPELTARIVHHILPGWITPDIASALRINGVVCNSRCPLPALQLQ